MKVQLLFNKKKLMSLQIAIDKLKKEAAHIQALATIAVKEQSFDKAAGLTVDRKWLEEIIDLLEKEQIDRSGSQ